MATGTIVSNSSISNITGFAAAGEARYGSNGGTGTPEYDILDGFGNSASGRITWYSGIGNFDSGFVNAGFSASPGGGTNGINWAVTNGSPSPVALNTASYGNIQNVQVRAAVQMAAKMIWHSVYIQFYQAGVVVDTYSRRTGPSVDKTGVTPPVAAEQILTVTPNRTTCDQIVFYASFELECASGLTPGANDIFGQVFLFA